MADPIAAGVDPDDLELPVTTYLQVCAACDGAGCAVCEGGGRIYVGNDGGDDRQPIPDNVLPNDVRREWEAMDRAYGGDPAYAEGTLPPIRPLPVPDAIPVVRLNYIREVARGHATQDPMWISARLLLLCDQVEALQARIQNEVESRETARAEAVGHYNEAARLRDENATLQAERDALRASERKARRLAEAAINRLVAHGLPIADLGE